MRENKKHHALLALLATAMLAAPLSFAEDTLKASTSLEGLPSGLARQVEEAISQALDQIGQADREGGEGVQVQAKTFVLGPDGQLIEGENLHELLQRARGSAHASVTVMGPDGKVLSQSTDSFGLGTMRHHIGIRVNPVSPEMRAQLGLDDGKGLLVAFVQSGSPAAQEGVKVYDIILAANGEPVRKTEGLLAAIAAAAEQNEAVTLDLLRAGRKQTVKIMPKKAASPNAGLMSALFPDQTKTQEDINHLRKRVEKLEAEIKALKAVD